MALINCKECGKEIGSKVSKCPHCGTDQRNWFMRHKILTIVGAFFVLGILGNALGGEEGKQATPTNTTNTVATSSLGNAAEEKQPVEEAKSNVPKKI